METAARIDHVKNNRRECGERFGKGRRRLVAEAPVTTEAR